MLVMYLLNFTGERGIFQVLLEVSLLVPKALDTIITLDSNTQLKK